MCLLEKKSKDVPFFLFHRNYLSIISVFLVTCVTDRDLIPVLAAGLDTDTGIRDLGRDLATEPAWP